MKTSVKVCLLVVVALGVTTGMAHAFWPGGLPALIERLTPAASAKPAAPPPASHQPTDGPAAGENELHQAEQAYDAGDFVRALELFAAARTDADPDYRDRATRGQRRAILAWALTVNVPIPSPLPSDPDGEVARRQAAATKAPSERAWYETTIFAAGCGSGRKLPTLVRETLSCAIAGGPVETRLKAVLEIAGSRARLLREAMELQGFLAPDDPVVVAQAPKPSVKPSARPVVKAPLVAPSGKFKPATKTKLAQAIEFERNGTAEYDLCGPDNAQRKEHRKASLELLKQARDIYEAAQEEDQYSQSLDVRMHDVLEMISHLRKEMNLGD